MNRTSFTLFFLLFVIATGSLWNPHTARAQYLLVKNDQPSTWLGFRLGGSIASENLSALPGGASTGLKFGFTGGLDFEHWFGDQWAITTGVLFMQKGIDQNYAPSSAARGLPRFDTSGDDNFSMNYFEIPVLLKMAVGFGDTRPFICAGPTFGFLASASESTDGTIPPVNDLKSYLNNMDISIYFGGGVLERILKGPAITFEAGYETGLTKVFKTEPPRPFSNPIGQTSATSSEILVNVGLMWGI
jgi:hypothetical protein